MLDEKFQQNALNLPYFIDTKTQSCFFHFSFCATFFPNECCHRPGHSLGKKIKQHEMKNEKNYMGFRIPKIWQLQQFARSFHQE